VPIHYIILLLLLHFSPPMKKWVQMLVKMIVFRVFLLPLKRVNVRKVAIAPAHYYCTATVVTAGELSAGNNKHTLDCRTLENDRKTAAVMHISNHRYQHRLFIVTIVSIDAMFTITPHTIPTRCSYPVPTSHRATTRTRQTILGMLEDRGEAY
jgi:hypothetical protein